MILQITADDNFIKHSEMITLPKGFLDRNLSEANGEFIKVYLLLIRASAADRAVTEDDLAERLKVTSKDIRRALNYWRDRNEIEYSRDGNTLSVLLTPAKAAGGVTSSAGTLTNGTASERSRAMGHAGMATEFQQLLLAAQTYIGKPIPPTQVEVLAYWYDSVGVPADLMERIIEECVDAEITNLNKIEGEIRKNWDAGIRTLEDFRTRGKRPQRKEFYEILRGLGIYRAPMDGEKECMEVWLNDYGFSMDIIKAACRKSVGKNTPFEYVDRILKSWHESGVKSAGDIAALDEKHKETRTDGRPNSGSGFNNFPQRGSTETHDELMERLSRRKGNLI